MKKLTFLLLTVLVLIGVKAAYAQSTTIFLQGDASTICSGPVEITVKIQDIPSSQPLQGFDIRVAYDPDSVSATAAFETEVITPGITFRNGICGPNIDYPVVDSCAFSTSVIGISTATNDGKLAKLTLTSTGGYPSSVQIYEYATGGGLAGTPDLTDPEGLPISHEIGPSIDIPGCTTAVGLTGGVSARQPTNRPFLLPVLVVLAGLCVMTMKVYLEDRKG